MSLVTLQKYQLLRYAVPDGTVDNEEKLAFLGITYTETFEITSTQKKQLLRLAVPDDSITTSDKFAFLGYMEAQNPSQDITEIFEVTWTIDTTLNGYLKPLSNDGALASELAGVFSGLIGTYDPVPKPERLPDTVAVGGFGGVNAYVSWQQREDKRKKDSRKRVKKRKWVLGPDGWMRGDN